MQIEIILKNYRCSPDSKPAHITIQKGFTAFVGINNSGKSSLLKFFYELRSLFRILTSTSNSLLEALQSKPQAFAIAPSISDNAEVFCDTNTRDLQIRIRIIPEGMDVERGSAPISEQIVLTIPRGANTWTAGLYSSDGSLKDINIQGFRETKLRIAPTSGEASRQSEVELAHVFQACQILSETLYIGPFRNAINIGTKQDYFDIQVGQAFVQVWRGYKTGNVKRYSEAAYRLTEDIRHILGFDGLEINPSPDDQTLQIFINGKSYKLPELGSGLTQFILVLANAVTKQPSYILIDEPELNLHPSLQLDFLTTLASYAREGILFGTHSIGLARAAFVEICRRAKIKYHVLERRAIENYFSNEAIRRVKGDKYQALGPYQARQEVSPVWAKAENWRIARETTLKDLEGMDLGNFLASL